MKMADWKIYPNQLPAFKSNSLNKNTQALITELVNSFAQLSSELFYTKESLEKNKRGEMLFSPKAFNSALKDILNEKGWNSCKQKFRYEDNSYGSYEVDFLKDRVACEVQLGKYAFMSDNVTKLEIYNRVLDLSDLGVLIVPSKSLQSKMSTGPGCFQQIVKRLNDLNYQLPLVVIGIKE